ncbi:MAG: hypothetical protein KA099_04095 [Alphaproteobacteria bacterium]|nr:hypothetical protein [Alphaproteobacteria bacterium]MBP7904489.1 hypothetical protein [Alphaproteobacteria bacterium]
MSSATKVTQVMAAEMIGKSRITINRHIKDGTLSKDADGKIDVSELRRVYGDNILTPEQVEEKKTAKESRKKDEQKGLEADHLRKQLDILTQERARERDLLNEQIDLLRERLEKSEEREKTITLLLTHQGQESAHERLRKQEVLDQELKSLKEALERLERQNEAQQAVGFFGRLFGQKKAG